MLSEVGPSMHRFVRGWHVPLAKTSAFRYALFVLSTDLFAAGSCQLPERVRGWVPARSAMVYCALPLIWRNHFCSPCQQPSDRVRVVAHLRPPSSNASEYDPMSTTALAGIACPPLKRPMHYTCRLRRPTG